jgi:phosphoribosylanthranilate isomerase
MRAVPRGDSRQEAVNRNALFAHSPHGLRIKVCCIASADEALMALDAGADALGLVSAMPSGPGVIGDDDIKAIAHWVGGRAATVLLTSRTTAEAIGSQLDDCVPAVLQLTDAVADEALRTLRARYPQTVLMPVVHVRDEGSVAEARHLAELTDAILLDSGNPGASVKELGGTGRVHDWRISRAIRDSIGVPVFLAGGLTPDNVADAVRTVRPFGVDVCSGVRRNGKLDREILSAFVEAARVAT